MLLPIYYDKNYASIIGSSLDQLTNCIISGIIGRIYITLEVAIKILFDSLTIIISTMKLCNDKIPLVLIDYKVSYSKL